MHLTERKKFIYLVLLKITCLLVVYGGVTWVFHSEYSSSWYVTLLFGLLLVFVGSLVQRLIFKKKIQRSKQAWQDFFLRYGVDVEKLEGSIAEGAWEEGIGDIERSGYKMKTNVSEQGILICNQSTLDCQMAFLPWEEVSRVVVKNVMLRVTVTYCAHLFLSRSSGLSILIPWHEKFNSFIPTDTGFENLGNVRA